MIKAIILDDEKLIVTLMADFLTSYSDIEILAAGTHVDEIKKELELAEGEPNMAILDLKMKDVDGVEVAQQLREHYPGINVVIVSSYYQPSFIGYMFRNGIDAFLPKGIGPEELLSIIRQVADNGYYFSPEHIDSMRQQISARAPKPAFESGELLSEREREVLVAICMQKTAQEIADQLFITKRTVESHKNNIMLKTGAKNSAGLVIYAVQSKIFDPEKLIL